MGNFTTVPDVTVGQNFPPSLWESAIMNNLNLGVARQLADTTLGASAASITFSSIPATFAHLFLDGLVRGDTAAATANVAGRLNSDSGANYAWELLQASATTVSCQPFSAQTSVALGLMAAASATANFFSPLQILIPNYLTTSAFKTLFSQTFYGGGILQILGGQWNSTSAINSVTLLPSTGNFLAGSRISLYGLPA